MKKTIFIFIALIFCLQFTAMSQKARVGITGGIASSNLQRSIGGFDMDGTFRTGIMGGMILDVPFCKHFSFQPDLHYIQKGATESTNGPVLTKKYTALRYAEMPLNFVYNVVGKKKGTFYFGGGPYISFDLPSKIVSHPLASAKVETEIKFGDQPKADDFRGVDYGGNAVIGYRLACGFFVSANYIQGSRNLDPDRNGDKIKNIALGFRVGYLFKNK